MEIEKWGQNKKPVIYLIGSLRNEKIPELAKKSRQLNVDYEFFDDWFSPGPEADDFWRKYEKIRGSTYREALNNYAARHIFEFDKFHIDRSQIGVLYMPCGKSAHLELGYMIGAGKRGYILFEKEPERWDVMVSFATNIFFNENELFEELKRIRTEYK